MFWVFFFFFKQKTAYEMLLCDWSSDVCSSDLEHLPRRGARLAQRLPRAADRVAAAGAHHARPPGRILRHRPEPDGGPVGLELFSENDGEPRLGALAHLGPVDRERDDPVGADAQPGVGRERGGARRGLHAPREGERNEQAGGGLQELTAGGGGTHSVLRVRL